MDRSDIADPPVPAPDAAGSAWKTGLGMVLPPAALSAICAIGVGVGYLLFHALAELFSIVIALTALVVATTSRQFTKNHFVVFIAVCGAFFFAGYGYPSQRATVEGMLDQAGITLRRSHENRHLIEAHLVSCLLQDAPRDFDRPREIDDHGAHAGPPRRASSRRPWRSIDRRSR